ncbi:cobyric acid synthase [Orenia marismortui]|uniref:Cobyric acid synthase n=1 Tax=Orenia marismortui TaxID=46469 RepID=A0A4R8H0N7_9FIRM|nr:cobyric acid synthase [Orenia marismortui]TDX52992.1 adenosylcobyric acid synthase (glutamine-hydrolysing) [Orenia marismortui]
METKTIMIQGTASHVGKSVLSSAFCRIFYQDGYKVAPFKSQNMALNSYVTREGGEIGRAQAVQAEAAKIEATVDMNPILLKPQEDTIAQLIIHGKATTQIKAKDYFSEQEIGLKAIKDSLKRLKEEYEVLVIEGAGSPAEVNLRDFDLVNMKVAKLADAPVILVADIDRGGVFADIIGTFELLNEEEKKRIKAIIINKFRGEVGRLKSGIEYIEQETGVPVLGVIPYFDEFKIPEEDAIAEYVQGAKDYEVDIAVITLPHISNFTDFDLLAEEPGVRLRYVKDKFELGNPDVIIIPGTKNTIDDLDYLYQIDFDKEIIKSFEAGTTIVGICGGYQILGSIIKDPDGIESKKQEIKALGLLDIETTIEEEKITSQVEGKLINKQLLEIADSSVKAYEIHMGRTELGEKVKPLFRITKRSQQEVNVSEGACSEGGRVWGTYLHGIFDNQQFRRSFINKLRGEKGLAPLREEKISTEKERKEAYNNLADLVRDNLNMELLYEIIAVKHR